MSIQQRLQEVRERIARAAARADRCPESVTLVAVSKRMPLDYLREAKAAGQVVFGESRVQEGVEKIDALDDSHLNFHLIGALQSNKARLCVGRFSLIETVHKQSLAEVLNRESRARGIRQAVLMQVNVSEEPQKSGVLPSEAPALARAIEEFEALDLRGLMAIGRYVEETASREERTRDFRAMLAVKKQVENTLGRNLEHLSMGMSHDFELAIECQSTMVRIGTAIFGPRM